jgi:glycerol-3-phosphate dehydrogenase
MVKSIAASPNSQLTPSPPQPKFQPLHPAPLATSSSLKSPSSKSQPGEVAIKCVDGSYIIPYTVPSRNKQIERLKNEKFDVLIIGGGAVGAGTALDCATRGLKCAMVERDDFSAGTSGRSTKLIHGGIRYLENAFKNLDIAEWDLVKEALAERRHMLTAAPYMNSPLPIMIPMFAKHWWEVFLVPYYLVGTKVYE